MKKNLMMIIVMFVIAVMIISPVIAYSTPATKDEVYNSYRFYKATMMNYSLFQGYAYTDTRITELNDTDKDAWCRQLGFPGGSARGYSTAYTNLDGTYSSGYSGSIMGGNNNYVYFDMSSPCVGDIYGYPRGHYWWIGYNVPTPLIADFTATPLSGPANLNVMFNDTSTNYPTNWTWDYGDGYSSKKQNVTHKYTTPGIYTVNHSAKNSLGTGWVNRTAYIHVTAPLPVVNFTGVPTAGSKPLTVQFNDTSTNSPTSFSWRFGDGETSTEKNPIHTYVIKGNFTVKHSATNAAGTKWRNVSEYIRVTKLIAPVAGFTGTPLSGTSPLTVTFTDTTSNFPTSWSWSFGDGNTSTRQNPSHTYAAAGTYDVSLMAANGAGSNTKVKVGYVVVTSGSGYPARYAFVEEGIKAFDCANDDARAFRNNLYNEVENHGWRDVSTPEGNPIFAPDARAEHWAYGTSADYLDKADFAYYHGHGNEASFTFENADGNHILTPGMAKWGYEQGSRIKWITLHSCLSLNHTTWENWKQSFYGLHMLIGYDTETTCKPKSTGGAFAQLMRGEYSEDPGIKKIWLAWINANQYTMYSSHYNLGLVYVKDCINDYLPGFGPNCGDPQRTQGSYDLGYLSYPEEHLYSTTVNSLQKTEKIEISDGNYSLNALTVKIPDNIMIYAPMKPEITEQNANKLSTSLGISGKLRKTGSSFSNQDNSEYDRDQFLTIHKDAKVISYNDISSQTRINSEGIQRNPPSDEQAIKKVTDVLTTSNLMPEDAVFDEPRHVPAESLTSTGRKEIDHEDVFVYLHREIDGIIVENSRVVAQVNPDNTITSLFMSWRDYAPYQEVSMKPVETAFKEFTQKPLQYHSEGELEKIVITDLSLRYYSQPAAVTEKYLQPVYVFEGYVETADSTESFSPIYIPATIEQFDDVPEGC